MDLHELDDVSRGKRVLAVELIDYPDTSGIVFFLRGQDGRTTELTIYSTGKITAEVIAV